jgi:hypothetical protein
VAVAVGPADPDGSGEGLIAVEPHATRSAVREENAARRRVMTRTLRGLMEVMALAPVNSFNFRWRGQFRGSETRREGKIGTIGPVRPPLVVNGPD